MLKIAKETQSSSKTLTAPDKTSNMYPLSKEEYSNILQNTITSKYKKIDKQTVTNINKEGIKKAREVNIIDIIKLTARVIASSH